MKLPKLKVWQWAIVGVLLVGTASALSGNTGSKPAPEATPEAAPPTERTITTDIVESGLRDAARQALQAGKRGEPLQRIAVRVKNQDVYGNKGEGPLLTLSWSAADLGLINWREIDQYGVLNLAAVTPDSPDAMLSFRDWCWSEDASGVTLTPRFCSSPAVREARAALTGS